MSAGQVALDRKERWGNNMLNKINNVGMRKGGGTQQVHQLGDTKQGRRTRRGSKASRLKKSNAFYNTYNESPL